MKLLVTGGAGFIGSNFIHYILNQHPQWDVTNLDKLTYAGNLENLKAVEELSNYHFVKGDITDRELVDKLFSSGIDIVVNFAAESHVDRSILDPSPFIDTNIKGTQVLIEGVRKYGVKKFIHISTDEVYGSIEQGKFTEQSNLCPSSPYSASKAAAEHLCLAAFITHGTPVIITRCSNNYGPYQFPEKLIPLVITNALEDKPVPVYGDGLNVRDWIYVIDHCRALDSVIEKGKAGEIYNIGASSEKTNLELIGQILKLVNKPESLIQFVKDRPGHDKRYAIDSTKIINELGWQPQFSFEEALKTTVEWYLKNEGWWRQVKTGDYLKYYAEVYKQK